MPGARRSGHVRCVCVRNAQKYVARGMLGAAPRVRASSFSRRALFYVSAMSERVLVLSRLRRVRRECLRCSRAWRAHNTGARSAVARRLEAGTSPFHAFESSGVILRRIATRPRKPCYTPMPVAGSRCQCAAV